MLDRTFGAVACDVDEEELDLETIRMRNQRFTDDPLSNDLFADLFALPQTNTNMLGGERCSSNHPPRTRSVRLSR
jgi:hypothetical protein